MNEYRAKMGENGRFVIPAPIRRQLHIKAGEEIIIRIENDELRIFSLKHSLEKARSLVRKFTKNKDLVKKLKTLRKEDADND